jgi:hypothetical protein
MAERRMMLPRDRFGEQIMKSSAAEAGAQFILVANKLVHVVARRPVEAKYLH